MLQIVKTPPLIWPKY
uniref:Uncharacterized protein n=1 Tax=Anguilla anguilla TaxID=7936 RepID=A0A0E9RCH6_ANGAN